MIKYFCDKCEKELENYDIFTVTITPPEIRRWDDDARTGDCILCRECLDAFQGWLELKTKDEPQNDCEGCKHYVYQLGCTYHANCEYEPKAEPQTEEWHDDCNTCIWHDGACTIPCCDYEPKNEPQTIAEDINRRVEMVKKEWSARHIEDKPQTETHDLHTDTHECVKDEPQTGRSR